MPPMTDSTPKPSPPWSDRIHTMTDDEVRETASAIGYELAPHFDSWGHKWLAHWSSDSIEHMPSFATYPSESAALRGSLREAAAECGRLGVDGQSHSYVWLGSMDDPRRKEKLYD